jgi:3-oxoacyl-[acyl-carrier protein] reductase
MAPRLSGAGVVRGVGRAVDPADHTGGTVRPVSDGVVRRLQIDSERNRGSVDLADRAATTRTLDAILQEGTIDAVVNNVGIVRLPCCPQWTWTTCGPSTN